MEPSTKYLSKKIHSFLSGIPGEVVVVAAAKTRTIQEVTTAIDAGIRHIGHNYVQEAQPMVAKLGNRAEWHMIGHLQRNKARVAVDTFDMIQTLDSVKLARAIQHQCEDLEKIYPVLIEINSAREPQKAGVFPENIDSFINQISQFDRILVKGILSMGPFTSDPEVIRPHFSLTRNIYERLQTMNYTNLDLQYLSMGMSTSYLVAIEEGANMIRIGTALFGERHG